MSTTHALEAKTRCSNFLQNTGKHFLALLVIAPASPLTLPSSPSLFLSLTLSPAHSAFIIYFSLCRAGDEKRQVYRHEAEIGKHLKGVGKRNTVGWGDGKDAGCGERKEGG